jgi:hypothetical protein
LYRSFTINEPWSLPNTSSSLVGAGVRAQVGAAFHRSAEPGLDRFLDVLAEK